MATPRKHWFRVADSIGKEPYSNDELATLIRLMGELNTRWARDGKSGADAHTIALRPADLMAMTGKRRADVARTLLEHLANIVSISVSFRGDITVISWPKWSKFQKLDSPKPPNDEPRTPPKFPPPQDAPARRKTQEGRASSRDTQENTTVSSPTTRTPATAGDGGLQSFTGTPEAGREDEIAARVEELRVRLVDRSTDDRNLRAIVTLLPWPEIETAVYQAYSRFRDGLVTNPTAYFVGVMKRVAGERGIDLGFREAAA